MRFLQLLGVVILTLALNSCSSSSFRAQRDPASDTVPKHWTGEIAKYIYDKMDDGGIQLSNVLYDSIDQFSYSQNIRKFTLGLSTNRDVYSNDDIRETWTVIDHLVLNTSIPFFSFTQPIPGVPIDFGFSIGGSTGLDFINIRQVESAKYKNFPTIEDEKKNFVEPTKISSSLYFTNPGLWVQLNSIGNRIFFPGRIPLTVSHLSSMERGEIVSYSGFGAISVGGNVGWNFANVPLVDAASLGLAVSTYIKGEYRISVLKEDDRFVRVKVSKKRDVGHSTDFGGDTKEGTVYDGLVVLNSKLSGKVMVGKTNFHFIPFRLDSTKVSSNVFDVVYRYDLSTDEGREAYEKAVLGQFVLSEQQSQIKADHEKKPVERLFQRSGNEKSDSKSNQFQLGFLFNDQKTTITNDLDMTVVLPDGTHHVFEALATNSKEWRDWAAIYEKENFQFTVSSDLDANEKNEKESLSLTAIANIEDTWTTYNEMKSYVDQVEGVIGKTGIFPDIPKYVPVQRVILKGRGNRSQRVHLGRSSFYFGLMFDHNNLDKISELSDEKIWSNLETAFEVAEGSWATRESRLKYEAMMSGLTILNVPLYLANINLRKGSNLIHATRMFKHWIALRGLTDPKERVLALRKLCSEPIYSYELIRALRLAVAGNEIKYFLTVNNSFFGNIHENGRVFSRVEEILGQSDSHLNDIDGEHKRFAGDATSIISAVKLKNISIGKYELRFTLSKDPGLIYFRMIRNTHFKRAHVTAEIVYPNKGKFVKGENVLTLDADQGDILEGNLARAILPTDFNTLEMSFTVDNNNWGPVATDRLKPE